MSTTLNMSESFIDWLTFENCEYSNHSHNETSNLAKNQQLTAHVELIGTCVTVVVVLAFFVVALFQCRQKAQEGQGPGGLLLTWDTSQRTMSFAFLLLLNAASFFISVDSDFRAWNQTRMQCTAQGVLYQFSFCGLMLETLALTVQVYMVLVKTVPLPKLYSWQFALPTFAAVYGVAAFLALVPLAIQLSLDVPVYHGGDKLGYCNLSFDTGCQAAFFLFWVAPALIILVTCLAMNVVVFRRILPVYRHMRSTVKNTLLLFITRRVIVLVLQMVLLFIQIVYISMSLAKVGNALGFYLLVSFLVHACGLVWLSVFLIPDQTLKTCVSRCRQGTAMASEIDNTGLIRSNRRSGASTDGVELYRRSDDGSSSSAGEMGSDVSSDDDNDDGSL